MSGTTGEQILFTQPVPTALEKLKLCRKCNQVKNGTDFYYNFEHKDKLSGYCKECTKKVRDEWYLNNRERALNNSKRWGRKNPEKVRKYKKKYKQKNREKINEQSKEYSRKRTKLLREEIHKEYGEKCFCCGEPNDRFLTMHHILNDGAEERKRLKLRSTQNFYSYLKKLNYPRDRYQLLCYNCNCAKGIFGFCHDEQYDRNTITV